MVSETRRAYLRQYQLVWIKRRRRQWIEDNGPCRLCGRFDELEVDHRDASTKEIEVAKLWSMSPQNPRRIRELAKCWVLCEPCHKDKSRKNGDNEGGARLTEAAVRNIRSLHAKGITISQLAKVFDVGRTTIRDVCEKRTWRRLL